MPDSKDGLVGPGFSIVNDHDYPSIFITTFRNSIESGKDTQFNSNRYEDPVVTENPIGSSSGTNPTNTTYYTFRPKPGITTSSIIDPDDFYEIETGDPRAFGYGKLLMPPSSQINAGDKFGAAVAIGCGRLVVGAPYDMQGSGSLGEYGSIHIFKSTEEQDTDITNEFDWIKKVNGPQQVYGHFGEAIAVGCGRIVVGAPRGNSGKGAAYVYDLNGNLIKTIHPSDTSIQDEFGYSVAVGNNRIVVGARKQVGISTTTYAANGAAYVFDLAGNQLFKLNPEEGGEYGHSVAVGSYTIAVSAPKWRYYNSYNQTNNDNAGKIWIYDLNGQLLRTTRSTTANRYYGWALAIADGTICISNLTGTVSDPFGSSFIYTYSVGGVNAYKLIGDGGLVFRYSLQPSIAWNNTIETVLGGTVPRFDMNQMYGYSLAAGNGTVVVGSPYWYDDFTRNYGAAEVFTQDSNSYNHHNRRNNNYNIPLWSASGWQKYAEYAYSVAVGNGTIAIGAPKHNHGSGGVDADMGAVFCLSGIPARKYFLDQLDGK